MSTANSKWTVTPQLFSGRPNPVWQLSAVQQKNWMLLWKNAALHDTDATPQSKLGYTGCRLQHDAHSHWFVYNGCVSFYDQDKIFSKKDEGRQMEQFLLNSAPEAVKEMLKGMGLI